MIEVAAVGAGFAALSISLDRLLHTLLSSRGTQLPDRQEALMSLLEDVKSLVEAEVTKAKAEVDALVGSHRESLNTFQAEAGGIMDRLTALLPKFQEAIDKVPDLAQIIADLQRL